MNKRLLTLPSSLLLFALVAGESKLSVAAPLVLLSNPSGAGGTNASFTLEAWPGTYRIQTTSSLSGGWSDECLATVSAAGRANLTVPIQDRIPLFIRAVGLTPSDGVGCLAQFQTIGSTFQPEVHCEGGDPNEFLWIWSDGTTSSERPIATKDFGSPGARIQGLKIDPANAITSINLGFDGSDGGVTTPLEFRSPQEVSAVSFPYPIASLRFWASSYCPITNTLDFTGFIALEAVECFHCRELPQLFFTNLPSLKRVCFEDCDLSELDLSGNPNLEDVRGSLNSLTNIILDGGTGPRVWHWCVGSTPTLTQQFADILTNFHSVQQLYIWNDNQKGEFKTCSTNLQDLWAEQNQFTYADLTGQSNLWCCRLYDNSLTNLILTGCTALRILDAHNNLLPTVVLDTILAELDAGAPSLEQADLSGNPQYPSAVGYAHYTNLTARGAQIILDWPREGGGVPGGANAITFVTTSRQPQMEIRTADGSTPSIRWHWGDGAEETGVKISRHDFGVTNVFTNYVEVIPAGSVTYFGAEYPLTDQGIERVSGITNFPNLEFLFLWRESVVDLSLAGCTNLIDLHLAANPVPVNVCDQWFIDLDQAVPGPIDGRFHYPASQRSSASDVAWTNLVNKGWVMYPW